MGHPWGPSFTTDHSPHRSFAVNPNPKPGARPLKRAFKNPASTWRTLQELVTRVCLNILSWHSVLDSAPRATAVKVSQNSSVPSGNYPCWAFRRAAPLEGMRKDEVSHWESFCLGWNLLSACLLLYCYVTQSCVCACVCMHMCVCSWWVT